MLLSSLEEVVQNEMPSWRSQGSTRVSVHNAKQMIHEATIELSASLGMLYGGRLSDREILQSKLKKAKLLLSKDDVETQISNISEQAKFVIDEAVKEIYQTFPASPIDTQAATPVITGP